MVKVVRGRDSGAEGVLGEVFDIEREEDRLWADGGYGAGEPRAIQLCCYRAEVGE